METNFNFKSQIATDKNQSERLLALGLKKETADMWYPHFAKTYPIQLTDEVLATDDIPAWSLHRLIEMIQSVFERVNLYGLWVQIQRRVFQEEYYGKKYNNLYENLIDCIEWLINRGHFNKEYLERKE